MSRTNKILSIFVSVTVLLQNVVLADVSHSSLWKERRAATLESQKLASAMMFPSPGFSVKPLASVGRLPSRNLKKIPECSVSSKLESLVSAVSLQNGTLRGTVAPAGAESKRIVVHVQDIHANLEAQKNIGRIVGDLSRTGAVGLVALEGRTDFLNFDRLRRFSSPRVIEIVANYLLRTNKISGPVYEALTSRSGSSTVLPPYVGIDDAAHYAANVEGYRKAEPLQADERARLKSESAKLEKEKTETFSHTLRDFDRLVQAHRSDTISFGDYLRALCGRNKTLPPMVQTFLEALSLEKDLDLGRVERERAAVLAALTPKLAKADVDLLLAQSLEFKQGSMSPAGFYGFFKTLCLQKGIDLKTYPALSGYVRYVLLADSIDSTSFFRVVAALEKRTYARLTRTDAERALVDASDRVYLESKLVEFTLTPDEWEDYKKLTIYDLGAGASELQRQLSVVNRPFERFYEEAEIRNALMVRNLLKQMDDRKTSVAVLVTGGFHSEAITSLLHKAGVATVTVSPRLTTMDAGNGVSYLGLFTQQKTPIEKVFAGTRLFTAPNPFAERLANGLVPVVAGSQGIDPQEALQEVWPQAAANTDVSVKPGNKPREYRYTVAPRDGSVPPTTSQAVFDKKGELESIEPAAPSVGETIVAAAKTYGPNSFLPPVSIAVSLATSGFRVRKQNGRSLEEPVQGYLGECLDQYRRREQTMRAENLQGAWNEIMNKSEFSPFRELPIRFEIQSASTDFQRTAGYREGVIYLEHSVLDHPVILREELEEELEHLIADFLKRIYRGQALQERERAASEVETDLRKIKAFGKKNKEQKANYLAVLLNHYELEDDTGFHILLLRSIPRAKERADVVTLLSSLTSGIREARLRALMNLVPFSQTARWNTEKENAIVSSLPQFYSAAETYPELLTYFRYTDQPQRLAGDLADYRQMMGELRAQFIADGLNWDEVTWPFERPDSRGGSEFLENLKDVRVMIFGGGASSRFYPIAKFLLDIGDTGFNLIQRCFHFLRLPIPQATYRLFLQPAQIFILTVNDFMDAIRGSMSMVGGEQQNILPQPGNRGTVGALMWMMACSLAKERNPDLIVGNTNSDHFIEETYEQRENFRKTLIRAVNAVKDAGLKENRLVAIGTDPTTSDTTLWPRFGLHRYDRGRSILSREGYGVEDFVEAATPEMARKMLTESATNGGVGINVGYYFARIRSWEAVLKELYPGEGGVYETYEDLKAAIFEGNWEGATEVFNRLPQQIHSDVHNRDVEFSIAYGILEPMMQKKKKGELSPESELFMVDSSFDFIDIGSWDQYAEVMQMLDKEKKLTNGNAHNRNVRIEGDVSESIFYAQGSIVTDPPRRIEVVGNHGAIKNIAVVHAMSGDVLVVDRKTLGGSMRQFVLDVAEAKGQGKTQLLQETEHCEIEADGGRGFIAVRGVSNLKIRRQGDLLTIESLKEDMPPDQPPQRAVVDEAEALAGPHAAFPRLAMQVENALVSVQPKLGLENADGGTAKPYVEALRASDSAETSRSILAHLAYYIVLIRTHGIHSMDKVLATIRSWKGRSVQVIVFNLNENGSAAETEKDLNELEMAVKAVDFEKVQIAVAVHDGPAYERIRQQATAILSSAPRDRVVVVRAAKSLRNKRGKFELRRLLQQATALSYVQSAIGKSANAVHVNVFSRRPDWYAVDERLETILTMWPDLGFGRVQYPSGYLNFIAEAARNILVKA